MAAGQLAKVVSQLRSTTRLADEPDAALLSVFVRTQDEAAFAEIVRRHGPMVLQVCRRVLGNLPDAEDAFQATFLILVRRAASIRPPGQLGNWLYGVARRTAMEARRLAARRRVKEAKAIPANHADAEALPDLSEVLDEELARLPDCYRSVVIRSDLQGGTRKEVARDLGLSEGTVASRLARGRNLLAERLTRRGLALSVAAGAAALGSGMATAEVSGPLLSLTLRLASGKAAAAPLVVAIAKGVLNAMLLTKLKHATAALLVVGLTGFLGGMVLSQPGGKDESPKTTQLKDGAGGQLVKLKANAKELSLLEGQWEQVSRVADGKAVFVRKDRRTVLSIKDGRMTVREYRNGLGLEERVTSDGTISLDATTMPKSIDFVAKEGTDKGKARPGIYELDGNTLRMCFADSGKDRPTVVDSKAGSGWAVDTWRRLVKFDEVVRVEKGDTVRLVVVLTIADADHKRHVAAVAKTALSALVEGRQVQGKTVVGVTYFIRKKAADKAGATTGFSLEQLEAIATAEPEAAQKLVGQHAWSAIGMLDKLTRP